ncbi:neural Wiskott-Aldrich syndrome protein [Rosa sericea]
MAIDPNHATATSGAAATRPLRPIAPAPPPAPPAHMYTVPIRAQSSPGALVYPSARSPYPSPLNFHSHPHPYSPHLHPPPHPPPSYQSPLPPPIKPDLRFPGLVAPPSSVPDSNGIRDKSRDDTLSVIQDRKVRITDGASLYALCRSWLRNGSPEESQTRYGDATRSLPKPSPIPMASVTPPKKEEGDKKEDIEDKDEESLEHVSPEDLLKRHVKRARKVRARLREERLRRIARYKSRLALLLPPLVEQFRNDLAAGN